MYELVNTSLPNGLIAGTHGFSTVAMTKGVSDVLRGRLENLCAYAHRTSVHDATYFQQNPVNWFHVTLPQGEHVVGRVAPAEFDYTGRTNRIARLRVFGSTEVPSVGGATVLLKERHWFVQPWQGDPKYLEEDRNTCGHLRMLNPVTASAAPTWESIFGSNGSRYAQQIAWQLESNLSSGGKAIYFKTSVAWDVSGERLLSLFSEVIDLLPASQRSRVTFATYPVAMPSGTSCNLRGVFDRDKIFDAASATQAWVDCENARVVHAEMLPTSGRSQPASQKTANKATPFTAEKASVVGGVPQTSPKATDASTSQRSYQNLILPQKKGPDGFVIGLIVATVIMLLAAGGFFYWMTRANKQQMEESGAAAAVEAEIKNLENEKEAAARLAKEKEAAERKERLERQLREEKQRQEKEAKEKAQKEADEAQRKIEREKAAKKADEDAKLEAEEAKKDSEQREKAKTAFVGSNLKGRGMPPKPKTGLATALETPIELKVFYYKEMSLTNEVAGFKPITDPVNRKRITDYALWVGEPKLKLSPIERSPVVIWMSGEDIWFDWSQYEQKRTMWFKNREAHDLQLDAFGVSDDVFETWNNIYPVRYVVSWGDAEGQFVIWEKRAFVLSDAVDVVYKAETSRLKCEVDEALTKINSNTNEINKVIKEKQALDDQIAEYAVETNKLECLKADLKRLREGRQEKKKQKKLKKEDDEQFKDKQRELNDQINKQDAVVQNFGIKTFEIQAAQKKYKLEQLEKRGVKLQEELAKKRIAYEAALNDPDKVRLVKGMSFKVSVKGVN